MADTAPDERENTQEQRTNRLAWFLTGAIIGATAALLYAPRRGKEARRYVTDQAQRGRDAVADSAQDLVEAGREMFERGRKLVEDADLFDRGRKLVKG
jgi:gas vesicle protein